MIGSEKNGSDVSRTARGTRASRLRGYQRQIHLLGYLRYTGAAPKNDAKPIVP
jgi:hypothetical protein